MFYKGYDLTKTRLSQAEVRKIFGSRAKVKAAFKAEAKPRPSKVPHLLRRDEKCSCEDGMSNTQAASPYHHPTSEAAWTTALNNLKAEIDAHLQEQSTPRRVRPRQRIIRRQHRAQ